MQQRACAVLLLALVGTVAHAQENIYVGIGYGGFDYQEKRTDTILGDVGDTLDSIKIFGGFEFNDNFSLEVSYGESGDLNQSGSIIAAITDGTITLPDAMVSRNLNIDFTTTALRAVGQVPLGWGVFLGGVGYFRTDGDLHQVTALDHGTFPEPVVIRDDFTLRNEGLMATLGLEWRFGRFGTRYGIRLEYEWWDLDDVNASTVGLAVTYGF